MTTGKDMGGPGAGMPAADKAVLLLRMLDEETRQQVMGRMDDEVRSLVEDRIREAGSTPSEALGGSIADQRRAMRETMLSMHQRSSQQATAVTSAIEDQDHTRAAGGQDPLDQLAEIHPAAIARALQGERAEAWAVVLARMTDSARQTLLAWLDSDARTAINNARQAQGSLPPQLRATAERAIQQTVLPRALREHELLMTTPMPAGATG